MENPPIKGGTAVSATGGCQCCATCRSWEDTDEALASVEDSSTTWIGGMD